MNPISALVRDQIESTRIFFDQQPANLLWPAQSYRRWLARYFNLIIPKDASVLEVGCGSGDLLALLTTKNITGIDIAENQIARASERIPNGTFFVQSGEEMKVEGTFDYIIVSDTLNFAADVQLFLENLRRISAPHSRLILNFPSALWRPIFATATHFGLRADHPGNSWLSKADVENLLHLSDWEPIKFTSRILLPWAPLGLDHFANRWIAPLLPSLCLAVFCIARPPIRGDKTHSVSVIIPARNEAGNIPDAVRRTPDMGSRTEIIFVEGHSRDDTWTEIQRVQAANPGRPIKILRQSGEGKGNAVREGFAASSGDILMILDADLTVPPEDLPKFYSVIATGKAEFANGVRLVYPMQRKAMPFLNLCANKFFSIAFSWLLGQPVKDTLCGTKALARCDYDRIAANRGYFGDFDPFGDFDLLLGADKLNLRLSDVPIHYQDRTYGSTNIRRWTHGLLLLRMLLFVARKLKFV